MKVTSRLALADVAFERGWLADRVRLARERVIPGQWEALNDRIPGAERSGCVRNLRIAAGEEAGEFHGLCWQDSDLAKWIEAASYRQAHAPDGRVGADLDAIIATVARAQQPDGYLNTFFQLAAPGQRWRNLRDEHELYVAGHLIEAGVAHHEATGGRALLAVAIRLADLLDRTFGPGPGQSRGYCGHPEVELALIRLARVTGEARYLDLAEHFVRERGRAPNFFAAEAERRGELRLPWHMHHDGLATLQAAGPVTELREPVGHAVRMMYLLAAVIDLAVERPDGGWGDPARQLWEAITRRHLYVTGGVGSEPYGEKFSEPHDLPPDRAYAETCAAIGVILCARRMLDLELDGRHADVMERALYNNVLAGLGLDGRGYFYVNPLEVIPAVTKRRFECHLVKTQRVPWFGCACCPPNVARLLASLGWYLASRTEDGLALHLFAGTRLRFRVGQVAVHVAVETDYPWQGQVVIRVEPAAPVEFVLRVRQPGWCREARWEFNGEPVAVPVEKGYAAWRREWRPGDVVALHLAMPVERIRADPRVAAVAGRVALQRGPVVYCVEEADLGPGLAALRLPAEEELHAREEPGLLGGCVALEGRARRALPGDELYAAVAASEQTVPFRAVPYALWANRGEGEMRVWLRE